MFGLGEQANNFLQTAFSLPVFDYQGFFLVFFVFVWVFWVGLFVFVFVFCLFLFWFGCLFGFWVCLFLLGSGGFFFDKYAGQGIFRKDVLMLQLQSFSLTTELKLFSMIKTCSQRFAGDGIRHGIRLVLLTFTRAFASV